MTATEHKKTGETFVMFEPIHNLAIFSGDSWYQYRKNCVKIHDGWCKLRDTIKAFGGEVITEEFDGDQIFSGTNKMYAQDPGIVMQNAEGILYSHAKEGSHGDAFRAYTIARMAESTGLRLGSTMPGAMDGGNVVIDKQRKIMFVGVNNYFYALDNTEGGTASRIEAAKPVREWLKEAKIRHTEKREGKDAIPYRTVPLFMNDSHCNEFYHLDGAFNMLPDGSAMVCAEVFSKAARYLISKELGQNNIFYISEEDARRGATNFITVGSHVITPYASPQIRQWFEAQGYDVTTPQDVGLEENAWNFSEGAGPRCAALKVTPDFGFPTIHEKSRQL